MILKRADIRSKILTRFCCASDHPATLLTNFFISDQDEKGGEGIILRRLADGPVEYPGKGPVVELLDQFEMMGPNRNRRCLVTEALRPWPKPGLLSPGES